MGATGGGGGGRSSGGRREANLRGGLRNQSQTVGAYRETPTSFLRGGTRSGERVVAGYVGRRRVGTQRRG